MRPSPPRLAVLTLAIFALPLVAGACNYPGLAPTEDTQATAAAQTVAAELTQSADETPPPPPTATPPPPTDTPAPTATPAGPSPTPEPTGCTDKASFITDVTVPDDSFMEPEEDFTKTWRLRNSGTCTWTGNYDLVFVSGQAMGSPAAVPLAGNVPPNGTVDISVDLTAPSTEGTHKGNFMLRNAEGLNFGIGSNADVAFWVQIKVGPTPTPEPEVYMTQKGDLKSSFHVDLDEGDFSPSNDDQDVWWHGISEDEKYLEPENGARLALWGGSAPSYEDCEGSGLSSGDISLDDLSTGDWICFETSEGRIGRFEIEAITGVNDTLTIDIRTWE